MELEILNTSTHPRAERISAWLMNMRSPLCDALGCPPTAEAAVVLVDNAEIHALNLQWRGVDAATDVLSFAMQEGEDAGLTPDLLGDVVVSLEYADALVASAEHQERLKGEGLASDSWTLEHEVLFLVIHGMLHLLGHDHAEVEEERRMRDEERRIFEACVG